MAYRVFPYKGFGGGLNLRDSVDVVAEDQAIDALNVLFSNRGSVRQRAGYAKFTAAEGAERYDSLSAFYKSDGTKQIVAGAGGNLEILNTAGVVVASTAAPTSGPHYFQRFGGPTEEAIYIANGVDTVRKWDGSAFSTPTYTAVTPTGRFLALSNTDNRLINARFSGSTAGNNPSTVRFSEEGNPLNFPTTAYVDLTPGDGEEITGIATWRDLVLVFKQTKFFVFYGNSLDDDGEPVFNYRPVEAGVGLVAPLAKAVAEQGVYFLDRTGVYYTNGSQPARVSEQVEPIFHGGSSVFYTGGELNDASVAQASMVYHDEKLWLSFPAGVSVANDRNLIFDPHEKWWSLANLPAGPLAVFRPAAVDELVFGYSSGANHIGHYATGRYLADDMSQSADGGVAIRAHWRGGWFNYSTAAVKTVRELKVSGSGLVNVGMSRDYRQSAAWSVQRELSPADLLYDGGAVYDTGALYGPSGSIQTKIIRRAIRGESFSVLLSNVTLGRTFQINRLVTHIREARIPTVVKVS